MRRVEKVRLGLIAGSVLLLVVLAGMFSYARYRAGKAWIDRLKARSGISIDQETDNYTISQSVQGRTVFTLRAAKGFAHKDGTWTLHDVVVTLYGTSGDRIDKLYGKQFEWDANQGIAHAVGEVQMDLQVPTGIAESQRRGTPATADAESANRIHVRTSGVMFLRKLGVAATQEQIEFHYGGLTCVAQGAELTNNPGVLHLLADVHMHGDLHGQPVTMTATKADFDRDTNIASFVHPILNMQDRKARADFSVLHLRKDGSVERAEGTGNVMLDSATMHLGAPRLDATLDAKNLPQTARFSGGAKLVDDNPDRPAHGEAGEVRLRFDAQGQPEEVTALNAAHLEAREAAGNGVWLEREMRGDQVVAMLHAEGKDKPQLQQVHAVGRASMRGDSVAKPQGLKSTAVSGDDLLVTFVPQPATEQKAKSVRADKLHGLGHTVLRQTAALGEEHVSYGDTLDALFADVDPDKPGQLMVSSAAQVGHVSMSSRAAAKPGPKAKPQDVSTGNAERAFYNGESEQLTLTGGVHLTDNGTAVTADSVVFDQRSGDAEARGNLAATLSGSGPQITHVSAQHGTLHKASQVAEFEGTASKPARLWQDASQVDAANITVDREKNTLVARPASAGGLVHSVFAGEPAKPVAPQQSASHTPSILRVESRLAEYSDTQHQAVFTGPVRIEGSMGEVRGDRTTAFFTPPPKDSPKSAAGDNGLMGGSLDHVVVMGDVKLEEPGRHGTGEQLVYKASDGSFVLTGTPDAPPHVVDAQQGNVTGASLLFRQGDSTIVITSAPVGEQHPQRAHTETHVRQKAE